MALPGFGASLDYYDIDLEDAITSLTGTTVAQLCSAGQQRYCDAFTFTYTNGVPTGVTALNLGVQNAASNRVKGYDLSLSYRLPTYSWGSLNFSLNESYVTHFIVDAGTGAAPIERAGDITVLPKHRATFLASYGYGDTSLSAQVTFVSSANLNNTFDTSPRTTVTNNRISFVHLLESVREPSPDGRPVAALCVAQQCVRQGSAGGAEHADVASTEAEPGSVDTHAYSGEWTGRSMYALAILTLIYTFNYVDRLVLSLIMPLLKKDMAVSDTQLGLISGFAFVLFYSLMGIPIARLADRSNRRNILAIGLSFWSLMTAISGAVSNIWQLAVARFLMGAGEAAGVAPSTSMVADMFKPSHRPLALGILTSGTSLALLLFFPVAGWISQQYGWRATFVAAGLSGLLLALVLHFTIAEPARVAPSRSAGATQEKFWPTIKQLFGTRAYLLTVIGGALVGISLYASLIWNPSFFTRVRHFSLAETGLAIGLIKGLLGLAGALLGGVLTARLSRRDPCWFLWTPGIACILVLPAELVFLLSPDVTASLAAYGLANLCLSMHIGPVYAVCQNIAGPSMRATATAAFLLVANLVGQIFGPWIVGYFNDRWAAAYGDLAIRYSLIFGAACACLGGMLMVMGGISLRTALDTKRSSLENA